MPAESASPASTPARFTQWVGPTLCFMGLATAVGALLWHNETAREVAKDAAKTLFGIFGTPFILESTVALFALFIVLFLNKLRLEKEGDGWVYMMVQQPEAQSGQTMPKAITQRLTAGTVMKDKPEPFDEAQAERTLVEGYLELGMAAQARVEFDGLSGLPEDVHTAALWLRVLASNLDTAEAQKFLADTLSQKPDHLGMLAAAAREQALWFRKHLPSHELEAGLWMAEADALNARA